MNERNLHSTLDELIAARDGIDRAINLITSIIPSSSEKDLSLQLAELEGWAEMEKYMSGRNS